MADDDLTQGEVGRRLSSLEGTVSTLPDKLAQMLGLYVAKEVYEAHREADQRELESVKSDLSRLREEHEGVKGEVSTHRDTQSRLKGVMWILGGILGVVVTVVASYIQSGRL